MDAAMMFISGALILATISLAFLGACLVYKYQGGTRAGIRRWFSKFKTLRVQVYCIPCYAAIAFYVASLLWEGPPLLNSTGLSLFLIVFVSSQIVYSIRERRPAVKQRAG